jgi:hypothetical protein
MIQETWYIGVVVDNKDPDKRRRLKIRGSHEQNLGQDKLPWLSPIQIATSDFWLPEIDEPVLVLAFGKLVLWLDLPNSADWKDLSDDDYVRAFVSKHKDVISKYYTDTDGFDYKYNAIMNLLVKNLYVHILENALTIAYNDGKFGINLTDKQLKAGTLDEFGIDITETLVRLGTIKEARELAMAKETIDKFTEVASSFSDLASTIANVLSSISSGAGSVYMGTGAGIIAAASAGSAAISAKGIALEQTIKLMLSEINSKKVHGN